MLSRLVERRLRSALREQPAAALLGPRQVGKTTLARALGATYFDLELESGGSRWAIECKLSTQPDRRDLEKLTKLADAIRVDRRILISRSSKIVESSAGSVCDLPWLLQNLKRLTKAGRE